MTGSILAIDPSSGSVSSQPGYALYKDMKLVEAGHIRVTPKNSIHKRLWELRDSLMNDFETPDLLVTEHIGSSLWGSNNQGALALQYSVGVIMSVFDCPLVKVSPLTWRKYIPDGYIKTDANDAIMLGYTAMLEAAQMRGHDLPPSDFIFKRVVSEDYK